MSWNESKMLFSVVIPVLNEKTNVPLLLKALENQSLQDFEVICVDNGSRDGSYGIIQRLFKGQEKRQLIRSNIRGNSYVARMMGAKKSSADWLAFLDADCIPDKEWLKNAYAIIKADKIDSIAGEILNDPATKGIFKHYDFYSLKRRRKLERYRASGGNCFYRKSVFYELGGFDITRPSGSDHKLSLQLENSGFRFCYSPKVIVYHRDPDITIAGLVQKEIFRGYWSALNSNKTPEEKAKHYMGILPQSVYQIIKEVSPMIDDRRPTKKHFSFIRQIEHLSWICGRLQNWSETI